MDFPHKLKLEVLPHKVKVECNIPGASPEVLKGFDL